MIFSLRRTSVKGKVFLALFVGIFLLSFIILPKVYPYGYFHYLFGIRIVLQRECKPEDEKYYLTLTAIVRNRARFMPEWIEFHLMQGIEHVYLYDNNSTDNLKETLMPYVRANLVTITPFYHKVMILYDGTVEILTQKLYMKDAIEKHACETRWMAMLDSDEFILPGERQNTTLPQILIDYEEYAALVMPWLIYTSNNWIQTPKNRLLIEAYTQRWQEPKHTWKQIIQPKHTVCVYSAHNFGYAFPYSAVNEKKTSFANWPSMLNGILLRNFLTSKKYYTYDIIRLHHYKLRSAEQWERRKITGKITGNDLGRGRLAMKAHWDEFFHMETVPSQKDYTTVKYIHRLKERIKQRYS